MEPKSTHIYFESDAATNSTATISTRTDAAKLPIIDQIYVAADPGATSTVVTMAVYVNVGTDPIFTAYRLLDASAPDTILLDFRTGLPGWSRIASKVAHTVAGPLTVEVSFSNAPAAANFSIHYHYETEGVRTL